jgi:tRNA dimethylallyltransferase
MAMSGKSGLGAVLIAGPTASGKSAAALAIAAASGGEIVNADALQVYRDLKILSARPGALDLAKAPHLLFGHVDGALRYSVGGWARDARAAVADIEARGKRAILVGGTGLYFRAALGGLSEAPAITEEVRRASAERLAEIGLAAFRAEVLAMDPAMARLDPRDAQRHIRAWEVFRACGSRLSVLQAAPGSAIVDEVAARIVIEPDRAGLYAAIDARFGAMLDAGALEEARVLAARQLDPGLPVMKAVGAAELLAHLSGALTLEAATALAVQSTRRLAKRQLTWFRNQAANWTRVSGPKAAIELALDRLRRGS